MALCERNEVSLKTGYKSIECYRAEGAWALQERSQAPLSHGRAVCIPHQSAQELQTWGSPHPSPTSAQRDTHTIGHSLPRTAPCLIRVLATIAPGECDDAVQ
jgi:hypothetical protein